MSQEDNAGREKQTRRPKNPEDESGESLGPVPELLRRAVSMGLSSFFTTEEAIRRAVGDTVPQDWVDFAALQSDRARAEFTDRLIAEFGRVMENTDLAELADRVLDGRTVEISIKLGSREEQPAGKTTADFVLHEDEKKKPSKRRVTRSKSQA